MINKSPNNKMVQNAPTEKHLFSGDGLYWPITIEAESHEAAVAEWEKVRKPITQSEPETVIPEKKVEAKSSEN